MRQLRDVELVASAVPIEARRASGIFYTPAPVAKELASWGVRSPNDRILDPSAGCGALLAAAIAKVRSIRPGARTQRTIVGVDLDSQASLRTREAFGGLARLVTFKQGDFLALDTGDLGKFDLIIGNPPYVRHHALETRRTSAARKAIFSFGISLPRTASYWAYFVVHAMSLLDQGGRLAMVLPGALLHADYAAGIREQLKSRFGSVVYLSVSQQLFLDAEEESILLLADGFSRGPCKPRLGNISSAIPRLSSRNVREMSSPIEEDSEQFEPLVALLPSRARKLYRLLSEENPRLGEFASIHIGAVTGANKFFVLNQSDLAESAISTRATIPIISRSRHLEGLTLGMRDLRRLASNGERVNLLSPPSPSRQSAALQHYLDLGLREGVANRGKCREREPWYRVKHVEAPDAFLQYMAWVQPRIALSTAQATSTNAVHRIWWNSGLASPEKQSIALGFLSTLAQLSAELRRRSYGGGVLKLEPSEARGVLIPCPHMCPEAFRSADAALRAGNWREAESIADQALLGGVGERDLGVLRRALQELRIRRHEKKGPAR